MRPEIFFSCDIEADGRIPGVNSMSSIGFSVAGELTDGGFSHRDPAQHTFYAKLRPISEEFDPDAAQVAGLDREKLIREGEDPAEAMTRAADWIRELCRPDDARAVFVAYPLGFDWMFSHYYFERFAAPRGEGMHSRDPFGFSSAIDIKSFYIARARCGVGRSTKRSMPKSLTRSRFRHTHNALDDAMGQAELFQKVWAWDGR